MDKQNEDVRDLQDPTGMESPVGLRPPSDSIPEADTEVVVPTKKRRFTKAYKLSVLNTVAELKKESPGKLGEYLRSEGLYYSTVSQWRNQQRDGTLSDHRKGTVDYVRESMAKENAKLKRQLASVQKKLEQAELLVDLQKKVSQLILNDSKITFPE
jgi:transposase-like protein